MFVVYWHICEAGMEGLDILVKHDPKHF